MTAGKPRSQFPLNLNSLRRFRNGKRAGWRFVLADYILHLRELMGQRWLSRPVASSNCSAGEAVALPYLKAPLVPVYGPTGLTGLTAKDKPPYIHGACIMSNLHLFPETGHLVSNGRLVGGIWFQPVFDEEYFGKHLDCSLFQAGEKGFIAGLSMSFIGPWSHNYFHWVTQYLPKLELADRVVGLHKIDHFLLAKGAYDFQMESLKAFGIDPAKLILIDPKKGVEVESILVTSYPSENGIVSPWTADFLRGHGLVFGDSPQGRCRFHSAVFLDRHPKRGKRHIQNHQEVMSMLSSLGVDAFDCGDLSFPEQVSACASARLIIGIHGAALVNMVFAPKETHVIELLPRHYPIPCFEYLSDVCQHRYHFLLGCEPGPLPGRDRIADADIIVPTRMLKKLIQEVLSGV